jgi:hypothetical protein
VRPSHLCKKFASYADWSKGKRNPVFTVLRAPVEGRTEAPKQKAIDALVKNVEEFQDVKNVLRTVAGAVPQTFREVTQSLAKTHTSVSTCIAKVDSLREVLLDRWCLAVDERLLRMERTLDRLVQQLSEQALPAKAAVACPPEEAEPGGGVGSAPDTMPPEEKPQLRVLAQLFETVLHVSTRGETEDKLKLSFDLALAEAADPEGAVTVFRDWLQAFSQHCKVYPATEVTPESFTRFVVGRPSDDRRAPHGT